VSVIDTATGAVSAPITVGTGPGQVAVCPARIAHRRR
jgi:YVTN family beta-propeller protein